MGLLSSAWKSIKGGFKKIGKTVKKGFTKFGKLMGKFGILGQIAMSFILPGIGGMFVKGLGSMLGLGSNITSLSTLAGNLAGSTSTLAKVAGHALEYGRIAVNAATAPFKTVTSLVTNFGKGAINGITSRIPGMGNIFEGPVGLDGFTKDLGRIGEGLKTTQFNAVKANKGTLDKLISEGADIGKDSYATAEGFYDPERVGKQLISGDLVGPQGNVWEQNEHYTGSRFVEPSSMGEVSAFDSDLIASAEPPISKDVYSETYDLASKADIAPKVTEKTSLLGNVGESITNIPGTMAESVANIPGNMAESVANIPGNMAKDMLKQAFTGEPKTDFGPSDTGYNVRETGIESMTSQREQAVALQRLYGNPEPTNLINSFAYSNYNNTPGWIPNESSAYHNTLRSLTRTA